MHTSKKKKQHTPENVNKKRIRMAIKVLEEIKNEFPETAEFIDDCLEQECSKENTTIEEVIFFFFCMPRSKKFAQRNIFYFVVLSFKAETFSVHLTKHVKLNSLSHDIYLRVV